MEKTKSKYPEKVQLMLASIKVFCKENLNREYYDLCKELLEDLLDEERFNLDKESNNVLAASIILAICTVNFAFDKNYKPFITLDDIFNNFKVDSSTVLNKEKQIRKLLDIYYLNSYYSIERIIKNNPLSDLVILDNELIHINNFPTDIQQRIRLERECYSDVILKRDKKNPKVITVSIIPSETYKTYKKFVDLQSFETTTSFDVFCFKINCSLIARMVDN